MTAFHDQEPKKRSLLKRSGVSGLVVGTLAILSCELPLVIIALGLGGVAGFAGLMKFEPPPALEIAGFAIVILSGAALIYLFVRNRRGRKRRMAP